MDFDSWEARALSSQRIRHMACGSGHAWALLSAHVNPALFP